MREVIILILCYGCLIHKQDITHILFIDPKGEREIIGGTKGNYKSHPKVKLAQKSEGETLRHTRKAVRG